MKWIGALTQTVAPATEPITTAEVKTYCRIDHSDEDTLIASFIAKARDACERYTNRQLITATWTLKFNAFPSERILLPRPPLQSVTSITYYDTAGSSQTLSSSLYQVNTADLIGSVIPAEGQSWPSTQSKKENAVTVTFVAGYGAATTNIPEPLRIGMMDYCAFLYERRGREGSWEPPNLDELFSSGLVPM